MSEIKVRFYVTKHPNTTVEVRLENPHPAFFFGKGNHTHEGCKGRWTTMYEVYNKVTNEKMFERTKEDIILILE